MTFTAITAGNITQKAVLHTCWGRGIGQEGVDVLHGVRVVNLQEHKFTVQHVLLIICLTAVLVVRRSG